MDPHIRKEVSLDSKGPLGAISAQQPAAAVGSTSSAATGATAAAAAVSCTATSEANSAATSRTGSRENLCEECIQNPLDLIDASIQDGQSWYYHRMHVVSEAQSASVQVDLSDSESEDCGNDSVEGAGGKDDAMGRSRRAGDLGVNKKGTPLYSREDIREQYCINDKELQVLDKSGRKGILGCFSNNGQAGLTPCTSGGGKGRKSILGSCIARTNSEEDLQELTKRPISPGQRGTTWNGRHYGMYGDGRHPDEDEGFDEHYFRRRPKSVCMSANTADGRRFIPPTYGGLPPSASAHLPPHNLGIPTEQPAQQPNAGVAVYPPHATDDHHRMTMAYGPHPLLRAASPYTVATAAPNNGAPNYMHSTVGLPPAPSAHGYHQMPPQVAPPQPSGGYTLPPTAAYFPVTAYTNTIDHHQSKEMMSQESLNQQPNTPDLLMHRRQGEPSLDAMTNACDDRRQKHVSFDSSSLMRSQTLATMDEASFQRMAAAAAAQNMASSSPSKSSERLIDGRKTPDFEFYSQIFPPELARQIMLDRMKRNSMRTQATQTDRNRQSAHISSPTSIGKQQILQQPPFLQKVHMVSEGVQTNGFNNGSKSAAKVATTDQQTSPPSLSSSSASIRPPQPPLPPYQDPPPPPPPKQSPHHHKKKPEVKPRPSLPSYLAASQLPGYQLQVYHLDGGDHTSESSSTPQASWYGTAPRSGRQHQHHHTHTHKHSHHNHQHAKATRSHSSGNVLDPAGEKVVVKRPKDPVGDGAAVSTERCNKHLQKSYSDGKLIEEELESTSANNKKPQKAVKFLQAPILPPSAKEPSEDEVSDRDLPELAPITQQDYQRCIISNANNSGQQKNNAGDDEPDLGKTLSPLGSTSSLQDLMECSSSARASADPAASSTKTTWIERERQKKSVIVIEPPPATTAAAASQSEQLPPALDNSTAPAEKATVGETWLRMDSVTSSRTNDTTTNTVTSEDYLTAPEAAVEQLSKTDVEDDDEEEEGEVEKVEHYLESPEKEKTLDKKELEEEKVEEATTTEATTAAAAADETASEVEMREMQLQTNQEVKTEDEEKKPEEQIKSPTHSFASSSSGSYSVHNTENGKKITTPTTTNGSKEEKEKEQVEIVKSDINNSEEEDQASLDSSGVEDKLAKRKQELKLDLDVNAPPVMLHNLPTTGTTTSASEESTENSMIWQRLPMGTGDVKRKRQAFEQQIKALSLEEKVSQPPPAAAAPASSNGASAISTKVARKIMSEEASNLTGSPGLARSPAMHQGFRQEEWVVERTPVNTPDTANDKVVVAMINLSDEETSNHVDSDIVFKSSTAATTPQDGSLMSSTQDISAPKESASAPENLGGGQQAVSQPMVEITNEPKKLSVVDPPAGFGDSPEHKANKPVVVDNLPGFHEAIVDQALPQEEQLLMASEEMVSAPSLHITEAFHSSTAEDDATTQEVVYSVKKESITHPTALETASTTLVQSLEQPQEQRHPRKLSSTSSTSVSRPSTSASKTHQSRSRSSSKERLLSTLAGSEHAPQTAPDEDEVEGLYIGGYDKTSWAFIGKLAPASIGQGQQEESKMVPLTRSESIESTQSEREFRKKYQAITHRMVHRKSSAVMYSRILERTFECNKYVRVMRVRGEFGFRIHGSRPVVVSAIEPSTPAESSGLEVGDIILTINGINVLDLPHTEVVKTAQTGCDELELGLARVHDLSAEQLRGMDPMNIAYAKLDDSLRIIMSGYLWKLSRSMVPTTTAGTASALVSKWSRRFFVLRADSCLYFFKKDQESRPLGATLASGCVILTGCEDEDQVSGVAKPLAFRLKWASASNSTILCLAADNQKEFDSWIHSITHIAQTPTSHKEKDDLWREMSRQKMKMSPVDFINCDCQGSLLKLDGQSKSWKTRFCVLSDAILFLYLDKESESALAALCLHGYRVQSTGNIGGNKKHTFELIPPDPNLKYFYFVADTETEKKRWMASLEYSIDRWMKLS